MLKHITGRPELIIVVLMVTIIAMLVIPLPPMLIDTLIAFNIALAMIVFIGSFYITTVLDFSSFPSILLITTVFRLALSITTSRMILLEADAGKIVETFGTFVIGGDLLVGMVIFLIVTIVQFIVITKGSERIAEVCARFALDGLPGKQMSIDADVRAGSIDADEARRRRGILESETQLYGSLDGAMKFIKGDAIAGIIIIFVNFVGGIVVANVRSNMSMSEAVSTYSMLTIGDGLVAQIPALLISVGAGFVVTRVRSEESNLGRNILSQVGGRDQVLVVVGVLCLLLAALPGFPLVIFLIMAFGLFAIALHRSGGIPAVRAFFRRGAPAAKDDADTAQAGGKGAVSPMSQDADDANQTIPETVPLALLVSPGDLAAVTQGKFADALRNEVYVRLGIRIPVPLLIERNDVPARQVWLLVNEVVAEKVGLITGHALVLAQAAQVKSLGVPYETLQSDTGDLSIWVRDNQSEALRQIDIPLRDWRDELQRRFVSLAARSAHEYFGIQETKNLMDAMERKFPELLKETYRNAPVQRIAQILQRLLAENVSVRNLKVVLEAIAQWAPKERDNILLAEHVRTALSRYISDRVTINGRINALLIAPETEELIRQNIKQTANGAYLQMPDEDNSVFIADLAGKLAALYQPTDQVVLLTTLDVRRFVKRLIEPHFPDVSVISFGEIADQGKLNILNTI